MLWRMSILSTSSPVESILDKESFTLEELLDEEEIIQECKALNSRLINFLRERAQVEQLLRYIVVEAPEDAESKLAFKFPFIACEIIACEIDVILRTLVEEEGLMDLLFSFLEPNRPHGSLLAGYFSKVVVCLMLRKTVSLMNYVQVHQDVFRRLVDLIGVTSIMEVLVRLVGADDLIYPNFVDVMQWLADSDLLDMIVDKLSPSSPPIVHANAAETLCAITRNTRSALAAKLSSSSYVSRIIGYALEDSQSKSALIHSLSVCISLLDPKRSASPLIHSFQSQQFCESSIYVNPETVNGMLPKVGDLLMLLNVSSDDKIFSTTYGELRPPLGKHRLKIVELIAVLLRTSSEDAEKELVSSGAIKRIIDLFFEYPFNNSLHHHVESIIVSCLESKSITIVSHLFQDCNLIEKILQADRDSILCSSSNQPTLPAAGRQVPRAGNLGHITRIANKIVQRGNGNNHIQAYLQEKDNDEWIDWQATVLQERNSRENIHRWACGRPSALQDRTRDSDEDDLHDRDYDVTALANNLSQAFRYSMYDNDDAEQVHGSLERDDEGVYFDDESAEVVISSLRLGDDQESLYTNSNWFAFQDGRIGSEPLSTSLSEKMDEIDLNETTNGVTTTNDDEVMIGEDEDMENGASANSHMNGGGLNPQDNKPSASSNLDFLQYVASDKNPFGDTEFLNWQDGGFNGNPFCDTKNPSVDLSTPGESVCSITMESKNEAVGTVSSHRGIEPSLFEEDVEFVGEERAMEQALKEGIVGEAAPLKRNVPEKGNFGEDGAGIVEFNDTNYWRVDHEVALVQE